MVSIDSTKKSTTKSQISKRKSDNHENNNHTTTTTDTATNDNHQISNCRKQIEGGARDNGHYLEYLTDGGNKRSNFPLSDGKYRHRKQQEKLSPNIVLPEDNFFGCQPNDNERSTIRSNNINIVPSDETSANHQPNQKHFISNVPNSQRKSNNNNIVELVEDNIVVDFNNKKHSENYIKFLNNSPNSTLSSATPSSNLAASGVVHSPSFNHHSGPGSIFKSIHQSAKRFSFELTPSSSTKKGVQRSHSNLDKTLSSSSFVYRFMTKPIMAAVNFSSSTSMATNTASVPQPISTMQTTTSPNNSPNSNNHSINNITTNNPSSFDTNVLNEFNESENNNNNSVVFENVPSLDAVLSSSKNRQTQQQTYKDRRKNYRLEKKKLADELISAIQDPTTVVMRDWLKVRTTLKQWNKYYCELRPGSLYLYKNEKTQKSSNWIGTVMLKMCELLERPSKKNGFCFKLFHPLEHPIWSPKGPRGEEYTSFMFPLPMCSVIFRAPSEEAGRKWMQAIEISLKCSTLLVHKHISNRRDSIPLSPLTPNNNSMSNIQNNNTAPVLQGLNLMSSIDRSDDELLPNMNDDLDIEKHFDLDDDGHTDHGEHDDSQGHHSTEDSDDSLFEDEFNGIDRLIGGDLSNKQSTLKHVPSSASSKKININNQHHSDVKETPYIFDGGLEEFGLVGDAGQTEDVPEENKSLLWTLLKQVRPGMDLSKVVLPTFILEPRSFLEKLTDYYYHCDIISKAALEDDPLIRMKLILKWYLSGFYKKPKGLKKPYNPILGETFRCCWHHPDTDSRTFYIAEQVSHHPPISAFYVTNRKDGYCISGSILAKSKFYGNSISAILEGTARITLLARGEDYLITFPYAHCKGIFWGPLSFELGGKVTITCEKTGYQSELEFKLKPFFGSDDQCNLLAGKLRLGNETMGNIEGHWDSEIFYKDKRKGESELFWSGVDPKVKSSRLKRYVVPLDEQLDNESEKLWHKVTLAIQKQDQNTATIEKTILEEAQRDSAKQRSSRMELWTPKYFSLDNKFNDWQYKMAEMRPWDNRTDVKQYEQDYVIRTLTRHLATTKLQYARSNSKNDQNEPQQHSSDIVGTVNKHRRFRRQYTCADPTTIATSVADANSKVDGVLLDDPTTSNQTPTSSSSKNITKYFDSVLQKMSTLQESVEHLKEVLTTLKTELNQLKTTVNIQNQLQTRQLSGEISSGSTSSTSKYSFAITKIHLRTLLESIPAEIRIVIIVLLAHLIFNYMFKCYTDYKR